LFAFEEDSFNSVCIWRTNKSRNASHI